MKKQTNDHENIFRIVKKNFFSIPISIKAASLSVFLLFLWWGLWADTFFSVFVKSIVDNVFWISVIWAILSISKLIFTLPIGALEDHSDKRQIITLSKIFYVLSGFLFFFAWIFWSLPILIIWVIVAWIASSTLFTTYGTVIREYTDKEHACSSFGLFFSGMNIAFVIWALISAVLIKYIRLPYLFLFIVLFTTISLIADKNLPTLSAEKLKEMFAKESFIHQFFREVFSFSAFKRMFVAIKWYSKNIYSSLGYEFLFNVLDFIGFLFIPIVAITNNLNLSEIAIIFAVMRLPYVVSFFTASMADKYNKKMLIYFILFFLSFLYTLLWFQEWFATILTISFGISMGLSILKPAISWLIAEQTTKNDLGMITWAVEFSGRLWNIVWAIVFWGLSAIIWLQVSFIIIGVWLFGLSLFQLARKG